MSSSDVITREKKQKQSKSVYALAFATAVSFMGIGLVDPILPAISHTLNASPSQAMLLFTSYLIITALAMFFTFWIASKLGVRKTLIGGLVLVILCSAACALSQTVNQIIGWRAIWGLGNALFISTALAAIVNAAVGGLNSAIVMYEAAIGIGMAFGPLAGGILGSLSWRGPFGGTSTLMFIAFLAIVILYKNKPSQHKQAAATQQAQTSSAEHNNSSSQTLERKRQYDQYSGIFSAFKALKNPCLQTFSIVSLFYNMSFFIVLAYSPFPLETAAAQYGLHFGAIELGLIFFAWGLLLAVTSVWITPLLTRRVGLISSIKFAFICLIILMIAFSLGMKNLYVLIACVVCSGFIFGLLNTTLTEAVMETHGIPRAVSSSAYSGIRFMGGAVSSAIAGPLAVLTVVQMPYYLGIACAVFAVVVLFASHKRISTLPKKDDLNPVLQAEAIARG